MSDRHAINPKAVRMPADLLAWYEAHAKPAGKTVNGLLVAALEEFRSRQDGAPTSPAPAPRGTTAPRKPKAAPAGKNGPESASDIVAGIFRRTNGGQK